MGVRMNMSPEFRYRIAGASSEWRQHNPFGPERNRQFRRSILIHWLLIALVLTLVTLPAILNQTYPDPDDALRRLEVRDLIAGQSWWDVSQYRLVSGMMHWSRLVDLPLAAVILPLRPLLGELMAERVAMVVVPLITLGCTLALVAQITRRLIDDEHGKLAMLLIPLSVPLIFQMRPMRIDHHGWQVVFALVALRALLAKRASFRSGLVCGMAIAISLTISLEGLPLAVLLLGLIALAWALDPNRWRQLIGAGLASFGGAVALHLATRGPHFFDPACDAMAPVWLAVLGVAAGMTALATLAGRTPMPVRFAALGTGAAACAGTLLALGPRCLAGPFGSLDPLVRTLWYEKVSEGLPIWEQTPDWAFQGIWLPVIGLVGSASATLAAGRSRRTVWLLILAAQIGTLLVALEVSRAAATANAFAMPGVVSIVLALLHRARAIRPLVPRLITTAGALLVAVPGLAIVPFTAGKVDTTTRKVQQQAMQVGRLPCQKMQDIRALAQLPPGRVFAPLDIAPEIIASTDHHAIASGHHRNAAAMHDVIAAFIGSPALARRMIVDRYHADYVAVCPGAAETGIYASAAPHGLWARLERGEDFDWLQPVQIHDSPVLAWRVLRKAPVHQ